MSATCCPTPIPQIERRCVVPPLDGCDLHGGAIWKVRFVCVTCGARSPWVWEPQNKGENK